jgi:2-iminobutanoate/2-iminopropanoate deaminase
MLIITGGIMMEYISTDKAPAAIGPYSQAIKANGFLFASGQCPFDPATGAVVGDNITEQAEQACKNAGAILEANGMDFSNVVKSLCFLADMDDFAAFNEVYAKYFISKPARSCVAAKKLPKGVLCELEFIAAE